MDKKCFYCKGRQVIFDQPYGRARPCPYCVVVKSDTASLNEALRELERKNHLYRNMKEPICDCHKADKNFDGKCYYSKYYGNCEHCWKLEDRNYNSGHSIDVDGNCNMGCC